MDLLLNSGILKINNEKIWSIRSGIKKFDNILDINKDFLNEMVIHLRTNVRGASVGFYGITKDPETHEYTNKGGSLRNYLNNNFNDFNWFGIIYFILFNCGNGKNS
ncbi:hypothetical protein Glove_165g146 [Diversispora epigaea]|uniref:Uncharacterized protein n=1 Tax=Diversispora epigaea TaxID=1348612 RepID=A0A397IR28_9GLOM|nr:hypothetical protein Glove_165g146 [Diversispora epigaea]